MALDPNNTVKFDLVGDVEKLLQSLSQVNVKIQEEKDKIKELSDAIKVLNKDSGARKDIIIEKANAQRNLKELQAQARETEKALKKAGDTGKISMMNVYAGVQLARQAYTALAGVVKQFIGSANIEEDSQRRVNFLFGEQGKNVIALAAELQDLTGVNNQVIQDQAVMAKTMGVSNENIKHVIQGGIGLSKTLGIDATSAVRYLSLAVEKGEYSMLNRYIPTLRTLQTESEKQAELNKILSTSFDIAKDRMNSTAGAYETLANTITDESEKIGDQINKSLGMGGDSALNAAIKGLSVFFQWMIQGLRGVGTNIGIAVFNWVELMKGGAKLFITVWKSAFSGFIEIIKGAGKDIKALFTLDFESIGSGIKEGLKKGVTEGIKDVQAEIDKITLAKFTLDVFELKSATEQVSIELEAEKKVVQLLTKALIELNEADQKAIDALNEDDGSARQKQIDALKKLAKAYDEVKTAKSAVDDEEALPQEMQEFKKRKEMFDLEESFYTEYKKMIFKSEEEFQEKILELKKKYQQEGFVVDEEAKEKTLSDYAEVFDNLASLKNAFVAGDIIDEENARDKKLKLLKQEFDAKKMSLEEYEKKKAGIELESEEKMRELKEQERDMQVVQAVSAGILATQKTYVGWGGWPWGVVPAGIMAALAAKNISNMKKLKFRDGGLAEGATHEQGGIPVKMGGRIAEIEHHEIINARPVYEHPVTRALANFNQTFHGKRRIPNARDVKSVNLEYKDGGRETLTTSRQGLPSASRLFFRDGGLADTGGTSYSSSGSGGMSQIDLDRLFSRISFNISAESDISTEKLAYKVAVVQNKMKAGGLNLEKV